MSCLAGPRCPGRDGGQGDSGSQSAIGCLINILAEQSLDVRAETARENNLRVSKPPRQGKTEDKRG